jgi:hypothetical protein
MVIRVREICSAADTGPQGDRLYIAIHSLLGQQDQILISFAGVDTATSSFVNMSFVRLLSIMHFEEIKRRFKIVDSTHQINDMIKRRLTQETTKAA